MKAYEAISLILKEASAMVAPDVKTIELDAYVAKRIKELGFVSTDKNYKPEWVKSPWEWSTCINVNSIIAHGRPGDYALQEGDIVSIDMGIKRDEDCADAALTVGVGEISNKRARLLYYAKQVVYKAIEQMEAGRDTAGIAAIIEYHAAARGFLVNRRFAGHRIGEQMHMKPNIYNTVEENHTWAKLKVGEIYCVEPMLTNGKDNLGMFIDPDGWTCITSDGKDSAFFEHMVEITEDGPKILTTHFQEGGDNSWKDKN